MMRVFVEGIGLCGPGLDGWAAAAPVLRGQADYIPAPANPAPSALLPANERRRAPKMVKLALAVGAEAFAAAGRDPATTPAIFASSGGDGETIHDILATLAAPQRDLSPTKFHNSVHNAAAGYWSIATGAMAPSTSLCAYDDSFAAGLLEAVAQVVSCGEAVALIAYDVPYPEPLLLVRPIGAIFGAALVLSPVPTQASFARLEITLKPAAAAPTQTMPALEDMRRATPAARALPLLAALACGGPAQVALAYLGDMALHIAVLPGAAP
ncbi:beta-ketoacyl synthase chain length factor [Acidocella sp.]|uniref:beta-ketoacyl synthase chain length factor n=1 Tax=Acidocella sp. TaxID=50710 RepID=UPI00262DCB61|nr:beta-ketoacyl synthase chain length factor [Acidocella sp.]